MRKKYQYILFTLIIVIVYELYLIFSFKYIDIQKDSIIVSTQKEIAQRQKDLAQKKKYFDYVNSLAYKDKVIKTSQNKKNPWEEVVFVVTKEDADLYKKIDVEKQIYQQNEARSLTYNMSNWQKWVYYIFRVNLTD
ncbi:MAG: hypothetical protein ACD_49C00085G0008 [uncultured bacterium (gcode 4)]|uniref:Septum formation initiator n=1 Tax=uncultured bacterium (gcode 4) TaxID=1234023 RepID=K2BAN3_9BACT|nr:MAG: hypothetical protein ACD_49C00085G0008 [uncultured bacterium (gcode 4)]